MQKKGEAPAGKSGAASAQMAEEVLPGGRALSKAVVPDEYVLGPGDGLSVNIWGEYSETYDLTVSPDGKVSMPTIGDLLVKGLTLTQAEAVIGEKVRQYYRNVRSGLTLRALRVFQVEVLGQVVAPGIYLATPVKRVAELVQKAGGVDPDGSERNIEIRRSGRVAAMADLVAFDRRGDESANPFLQDGDVIFVPTMGNRRVTVYVQEVSESAGGMQTLTTVPRVVEIKPGERLSSVISEIGGASPWWDLESVFIQRESKMPEGEMRIPVSLSRYYLENDDSQDPVLESGDQVFIAAEVKRVFVVGAVKIPAAYSYLPGRSAQEYLMQAGGPLLTADLDRSFVKRIDGSETPFATATEIQSGDSVVVLEKIFKTWQDYFAMVGTVTGVILSAVGFYGALTGFGR